jgi:hypothetical protein
MENFIGGFMKRIIIIVFFFLYSSCISQNRILVSQEGDVFPLSKTKTSSSIITKHKQPTVNCNNRGTFGYSPDIFPMHSPVVGTALFHKQVMAMRFEAPASGYIDTISWVVLTPWENWEGASYYVPTTLRIFKSSINPFVEYGTVINTKLSSMGILFLLKRL